VEIYLVGGAVRDALLGVPVRERDWVVVGSTPEEMLRLGYRQVGRDFPVFLHPQTNAEYALARTERKVGPGHTGFVCHAGPEVTLEEDLKRRDLTINAMAQADDGTLIDPWGGAADLAARRLRHVSDAFVEDPLRVFRVARFAAQLAAFDFRVEAGTAQLMSEMCRTDVVAELAPERIWQEVSKALATVSPGRFFEVLIECGGMTRWLAELAAMRGVAAFTNERARKLSDPLDRFGALGWLLGASEIATLSDRLRLPNDHRRIALDVARHGRTFAGWRTVAAEALLEAMKSTGAVRQPEWFARVVSVVAECASVDLSALIAAGRGVAGVSSETFRNEGLEGQDLGKAIDVARTDVIRAVQTAS
jgi:tRNA nucleotidyltransferase (CCA-adding enzyme)